MWCEKSPAFPVTKCALVNDGLLTEEFDVLFRDALRWLWKSQAHFSGNSLFHVIELKHVEQNILLQLRFRITASDI